MSVALIASILGTPLWASEDAERSVDKPVRLLFKLTINPEVYIETDWGQPPQLAIWLERPDGSKIKTVCVTHRTASGRWMGKSECPVSLPYWVGRYNKETKTIGPPSFRRPAADAISRPTPKKELLAEVHVPAGDTWDYFIEVNASGDFNEAFPSILKDSIEDQQGNGQPSLIYRGRIKATIGSRGTPKLLGRTEQLEPVTRVTPNMAGVTTAKRLLSAITVSCKPVANR